ncbi:MAG: glycosyltransferase [Alicyclobacillus sp.]|nr:glycosyltransferase [Alicyclobacillus sp.]
MFAGLVIWALAVYGAWALVRSVVRYWQQRLNGRLQPMAVVLIVQNAQAQVEGVLRSLLQVTAGGQRDGYILVFDVASCDDTPAIVQRLAMQFPRLTLVSVADERELGWQLQSVWASGVRVGYLCDLRVSGWHPQLARDVRLLCG